ncbi:MAG: septation protein SpoVG family protein [Candidatus Babeliales bacterium]|nr:septation protein SpoVG family protein [Candidatus Babeliales bacterium]
MHISEIEIALVQSQNGLVAFASLVFENAFYMSSIGIFTRSSGGYRLTYPIRKNSTKNLNVFFPINKEVADEIEEAVIKKFEEMKK